MTFVTAAEAGTQISPELKEWLECKDFVLAMEGAYLGQLPVDTTSLRYYDESINSVFAHMCHDNDKINTELKKIVKPWFEASDYALVMALEVEKQIDSGLKQLQKTSLHHKREVLRHMYIIPTAIAAAYLGVTEDDLNGLKRSEGQLFGTQYLGGHCYSMEELNLIARNIGWLWHRAALAADYEHKIVDVAHNALDQVVMVDEVVACACTNMTLAKLIKEVPHTALNRRRYRLSDLEKVRIAKLNAST
jgi:hypothetical protein